MCRPRTGSPNCLCRTEECSVKIRSASATVAGSTRHANHESVPPASVRACATSESRQKSAFITVLRSAFNQEADEAWLRAPSSSRSIEGLYGQVAREGLGRQPDRLQ